MKFEIKQDENAFKPFDLSIRVEDEGDLALLVGAFNSSQAQLLRQAEHAPKLKSALSVKLDKVDHGYQLYDLVMAEARNRGLAEPK